MPLVAVQGDNNTGGAGSLHAGASTVYVEGKLVVNQITTADPDGSCPVSPHCGPSTAAYSSTVYVEGKLIHRIGDARICGHTTIETGNHSVYAG